MPDHSAPAQILDRITTDALALDRALRTGTTDDAYALAAWITETQDLADTALYLFRSLAQHTPHPTSADLLLLERVAHIAKAAQDTGAELAAALARAVENRRRRADAVSPRVVLIGPSPQQFIESAIDLLDRIPALCHAIHRDRLAPPNLPPHQPR
ncbi:hypothetical protein [Streptomyces hygroscopicus]|uniref:hypothetical protein n=1 Tax=Streptomyces hygroscopicus TaxID=1912 RepID=UPI001FCAC833|nr:hypothetical protein [Streptomyces hygroscopicus]BDH15454.1 hypothetical protein HOK021_66330 [Streptomyces hygroscopicus]